VLEVDLPRRRIALSLKTGAQSRDGAGSRQSPAASRPFGRPAPPPQPAEKPRPSGAAFSNAFADAFGKRTKD
jgi:transcriptional accessory protein Tex/SPT6